MFKSEDWLWTSCKDEQSRKDQWDKGEGILRQRGWKGLSRDGAGGWERGEGKGQGMKGLVALFFFKGVWIKVPYMDNASLKSHELWNNLTAGSVISPPPWVIGQACGWLIFCQLDIKPIVVWEEETSTEKMPLTEGPRGNVARACLLYDWYREVQPTVGDATSGQGVLAYIQSRMSKPWKTSQ